MPTQVKIQAANIASVMYIIPLTLKANAEIDYCEVTW
jgi:hypothetical protein